jgi:hypothetical protein
MCVCANEYDECKSTKGDGMDGIALESPFHTKKWHYFQAFEN